MKRVPTEELVTLLVRDLEATRRIARLRTEFGLLAGVGGLVVVLVSAYRGLRPDVASLLRGGEAFTLVATGLLAAALGACAAALASARPDRERLARRGLFIGGGGLVLAAALAALCFADPPTAVGGAALHAALACSVSGIVFSVPLSILAAFLLSRGVPRQMGLTAAAAALGATAFGALGVHLTCTSPSVWHWITGHALAPALGAGLLAAPLRALTLRWERGR
jgi:hypothetical protein